MTFSFAEAGRNLFWFVVAIFFIGGGLAFHYRFAHGCASDDPDYFGGESACSPVPVSGSEP